jgi:hypothetical protein
MSNERIDLTQFEGATEGPWETIEPEHPHYGVIRIKPCSATVRRYQSDFRSEETWHANAKAIAAVPELIAELKRCYEELDKWTYYATYIENVDMDCHQDASAEAGFLWKCTDCGAHFELPENGIYECEFGCDASE